MNNSLALKPAIWFPNTAVRILGAIRAGDELTSGNETSMNYMFVVSYNWRPMCQYCNVARRMSSVTDRPAPIIPA